MSEILGTLFKYLVSLLGVAAVVLILYQVFGSNKTQTAIADMTLLQTNAQALYNAQNTFTSLTNTVAISGELAPKDMVTGASTMVNPWGGAVTVAVNSGNASRFNITQTAVPAKDCAKMATAANSAVVLSINTVAQTLPMEAGAAVTACNAALNTLVFTFGK